MEKSVLAIGQLVGPAARRCKVRLQTHSIIQARKKIGKIAVSNSKTQLYTQKSICITQLTVQALRRAQKSERLWTTKQLQLSESTHKFTD